MTKIIILSVALGMGFGNFLAPDFLTGYTDHIITMGLCVLLLMVGIDIGRQESIFTMIKKSGIDMLLVPIMTIIGSIVGSAITGIIFLMPFNESAAVGSGLGWYSLAPMMIAEYSTSLSALSFMSNVMRELSAVILIPIVAKKIGYLECISLGGAASMDVLLPIVEKATDGRIAIYSFTSGVVASLAVPFLVSIFINI